MNKKLVILSSVFSVVAVGCIAIAIILTSPKTYEPNVIQNFASCTTENTASFTWSNKQGSTAKQININVTVDGTTQTFVVKNANSWDYKMQEDKLYSFDFTPILKNGKEGTTVSCSRYNSSVAKVQQMPRMEILTENYIWPTCDYVSPPAGCIGQGIINAEYVPSTISLYDAQNNLLFDSTSQLNEETKYTGAKIKLRGNTSAYYEKAPYKIKLNKKTDLLNGLVERDNKSYADKNWVLLTGGQDPRQIVGCTVNEIVGMDWTPNYCYISLYVNGDYRGLYVLSESVKDGNGKGDEQSRCAIDSDGYIFESDAYWWKEDLYVSSELTQDTAFRFTFKYPDVEEFSDEAMNYFNNYIAEFEKALTDYTSEDYLNYIDLDTFSKWYLAHDILGNRDIGGSNVYFTKKDASANSKIRMSTLWDFDAICGISDHCSIVGNSNIYLVYLLNRQAFKDEYYKRLLEIKEQVTIALEENFDKLNETSYDYLLSVDKKRWKNTYANSLSEYKNQYLTYLNARIEWLVNNPI